MLGVVDGERSNAFHFASPRICHVINSVIGGTLGFRKSRIGQESSQESFQKERFGLLGSVSRKKSLTSENVPKRYAALCVSSALSRRRSPVRIRSELPEITNPPPGGFLISGTPGRMRTGGSIRAVRLHHHFPDVRSMTMSFADDLSLHMARAGRKPRRRQAAQAQP